MYKKILVPLDSSPQAEAALPHVENLATTFNAELILIGIAEVQPLVVAYDTPLNLHELHEQQTEYIHQYLLAKQGEFREKGIAAKILVGHGSVVENIIHAAEQEAVDLIAMASHGRTGLAQVFYGSVAAGVLHRVNHPLLLVRSL